MLLSLGLPMQERQVVVAFVGHGARNLVERVLSAAGGGDDPSLRDEALRCFLERYAEHLLDHTVAYPGIPAVLERLAGAGLRLSVATNKPELLSRRILRGLGLEQRFFALIGGDTLPTRKPDPAGVALLVRRSGVALGETLVVGDSPIDVATARAAGAAVCAVTWGLTDRPTLVAAEPDFVVDRAQDLLRVAS